MHISLAFIFLSICTVLDSAAYVPQIVQLIRTKSARDINLSSWFAWVVSYGCYLGYVLLESPEAGIIFLTVLNIALIITVCTLTAYYKYKKRRHKNITKKM